MVLSRTGPRTVSSDAGFEVEEAFPDYLEYREAGRVFRISAEMSTGPGTTILLYNDAVPPPRWQEPHRDDPLDADAVRTILVRVTAAMLLLNIHPYWETTPRDADRTDWPAIEAEARALLPRRVSGMGAAHDLLARTYAAFNARDIDAVLALMDPEVDWPNGMEGGRVHGHAAVREYWIRQWGLIDPHVKPVRFTTDATGQTVVDVHQIVRDLTGNVLSDQMVQHVYVIQDGVIRSMDIRT